MGGEGVGATKHDDVHSPPSSGFSSIIAVRLDVMLLRYRGKYTMREFRGLSRAAAENSDAASRKNSSRTFRPSKMTLRCFETSTSDYPLMRLHIPEESSLCTVFSESVAVVVDYLKTVSVRHVGRV